MDIFHSLGGMMEVEILSADPGYALYAINSEGITIFEAKHCDDEMLVRFHIQRQDFNRLKHLADKKNYTLRIIRQTGLYWVGKRLAKRPVLLIGMLFLTFLAMFLPTRVYLFRVEGNVDIPTRLILEKCEECGVVFGASRREVRSEKMKNALLEAIPELQWAGINTSGCTATISVRERTITEKAEEKLGVSSIVALRDGVITGYTVTSGNPLCKVGQAVKAGQVLISGYTDCGISIRATHAEGEIYAQTERTLTAVTPQNWQEKTNTAAVVKKYALIIGKKRINFNIGSGISGATCDKMYEESFLTLPGGFQLPVCLVTETWTYYDTSPIERTAAESEQTLTAFSRQYTISQMIAGRILSKKENVMPDGGVYILNANYPCLEMIGQVKKEEIPYGKYD